MKTTLLTIVLSLQAQLNQVLTDYATPIAIFIVIASGIAGAIFNLDKILDLQERGTRKEGIWNIIYIMGGVLIVVGVIAAIMAIAKRITISM